MSNNELNRFIEAQKFSYSRAFSEIQAGRKRTHWMWYIFPQLKALGRSSTALHYGIADIDEAKAYMAEPYCVRTLSTSQKLSSPLKNLIRV